MLSPEEATERLTRLLPSNPPTPAPIPAPTAADPICGGLQVQVQSSFEGAPSLRVQVSVEPAESHESRIFHELLDRGYILIQKINADRYRIQKINADWYRAEQIRHVSSVGPAAFMCATDDRFRKETVACAIPGVVLKGMHTIVLSDGPDPEWAWKVLTGEIRPYHLTARVLSGKETNLSYSDTWVWRSRGANLHGDPDVHKVALRAAQMEWHCVAKDLHEQAKRVSDFAHTPFGIHVTST